MPSNNPVVTKVTQTRYIISCRLYFFRDGKHVINVQLLYTNTKDRNFNRFLLFSSTILLLSVYHIAFKMMLIHAEQNSFVHWQTKWSPGTIYVMNVLIFKPTKFGSPTATFYKKWQWKMFWTWTRDSQKLTILMELDAISVTFWHGKEFQNLHIETIFDSHKNYYSYLKCNLYNVVQGLCITLSFLLIGKLWLRNQSSIPFSV